MIPSERALYLLQMLMERRRAAAADPGPGPRPSTGRVVLEILLGRRSRGDLRPAGRVGPTHRCYPKPLSGLDDLPEPGPHLEPPGPFWRRWPIRRRDQMVFAEAFGQGLAAGLGEDRALAMAAAVNPSPRFRRAIARMRWLVRGGDSLAESLTMSGAWVDPGLRAALQVGEEQGGLDRELIAFARGLVADAPRRFRRAVGRSPRAVAFAAALARRLDQHRLTVEVVRAAGLVAAAGSRRFARVVRALALDLEDGSTLADALSYHPGHFDAIFCLCVEAAGTREELRACLEALGSPDGSLPRDSPALLQDDRDFSGWINRDWFVRRGMEDLDR